jgi:S1-C subfamily serine protease
VSALAFLACLAAAANVQEPIALAAGVAWEGELAVDTAAALDFRLELPLDVIAVDLELECLVADLDLAAAPAGGGHGLDAQPWSSAGEEGVERLLLRRMLQPDIGGARIDVRVQYVYDQAPIQDGRPLARAPFKLLARVHGSRVDAALAPLVPLRAELDALSGGFRVFSVEVPEGAACLRLDLFDVDGDLDLFAAHRVRVLSTGARTATAMNPWGAEHLVLDAGSTPGLRAGTWFVHVENLVDPLERASFGIVASFAAQAPECVRGLPQFPAARAVERPRDAVPAVFELFSGGFGGSGTCISQDGWILTNAHVVAGGPGSAVVVCVPLERGRAARESFLGRVVEFEPERDLALVHVVSGFRGEPIPEGYAFPWVPLREGLALEPGDELWLVGYPGGGGQHTRVTVSISRGIVSGFETGPWGLVVKTDAELQVGSSGGAALDASGRLLGVPSTLVELGAGQFGYVLPLESIPATWRARFAPRAQR